MSEHFVGKYEVELKFNIVDVQAFSARLLAQNPTPHLLDNHEQDTYFEAGNAELARRGLSMCVRSMMPSGVKLWIVKGPGKAQCEAVDIACTAKAISMLTTLGYRIAFIIEKRRSIYFLGKFHVTVDRLNGLGDFAEIAIMTNDPQQLVPLEQELMAVAQSLGLCATDIEPRAYRTLLGH